MKLDRLTHVEQAVCIDWYDGAVGGLVLLADSADEQRWFRFELLAWDQDQNNRVFCLATAMCPTFEKAGTPRIWWLQRSDEPIGSEFDRARQESRYFNWLMVSDGYFNRIVELVELTSDIRATIPMNLLPDYNSDDFARWMGVVSQLA